MANSRTIFSILFHSTRYKDIHTNLFNFILRFLAFTGEPTAPFIKLGTDNLNTFTTTFRLCDMLRNKRIQKKSQIDCTVFHLNLINCIIKLTHKFNIENKQINAADKVFSSNFYYPKESPKYQELFKELQLIYSIHSSEGNM